MNGVRGRLLFEVTGDSGQTFPVGTEVYAEDYVDVDDLLEASTMDDELIEWTLPDGEVRALEPDAVDFDLPV